MLDVGALIDGVMKTLGTFGELFEQGTLEEKEFIRLFVDKIEVNAEEKKAVVHIRRFPAPARLGAGNSSFEMVAGARCEHQKTPFPPVDVVEVAFERKGSTLVPVAA